MPRGAYNLDAYDLQSNQWYPPVPGAGLTVNNYSINLATTIAGDPAIQNFNNTIQFAGVSNNYIHFAYALGGPNGSNCYDISLDLSSLTMNIGSVGNVASRGNDEVACAYNNRIGNGQYNGSAAFTYNLNSSATASNCNFVFMPSYVNNGSTTGWAGGNTNNANLNNTNYDKGRAIAVAALQNQVPQTSVYIWLGVSHNSGTNYIATYRNNYTNTITARLGTSNTNAWNIDDGIRMCAFTNTTITNYSFAYVGYKAGSLYFGTLNYNDSAASIQQGSSSLGISYTSRNAMIAPIYNVNSSGNLIQSWIAAVMVDTTYLKFVRIQGFGSSHNITVASTNFYIDSSGNPNPWYRLCATGIPGIGAIVYLDQIDNNFYVKFFSINWLLNSITWQDPILLQANPLPNITVMNADVKYTNLGFSVGIGISDTNGTTANNQVLVSTLYPARARNNVSLLNYPALYMSGNTNAATPPYTFSTRYKWPGNIAYSVSSGTSLNYTGRSGLRFQSSNCFSAIGNGAYTIEGWFYITNNVAGDLTFFDVSGASIPFRLELIGNNLSITVAGVQTTDTGFPLSLNTWYHIAAVSSGTATYGFVNGTYRITRGGIINWASLGSVTINLCCRTNDTNSNWTGQVQDFRVSNVARYPAAASSFTAPTGPFKNDLSTLCLYHFQTAGNNMNSFYDDWGPNYFG